MNATNQAGPTSVDPNEPPTEIVDANATATTNRKQQRLEQARLNAANSNGPIPTVTTRPAAENSEITVELRDVARETRTFKNHPSILKLERLTNGNQISLVVTLRDGRRVELASSLNKSIEAFTTAELTQLVADRAVRQRPADQVKKENR